MRHGCNCWQLETVATVRRLWRINVNNIITNEGKAGGGGNLLTAQLQLHCQRHQSMCERERQGERAERYICAAAPPTGRTGTGVHFSPRLNEISIQFGLMSFNEIHTQTVATPLPPSPLSSSHFPYPFLSPLTRAFVKFDVDFE